MKYLDLDLKQRKFLDWLILGGREFIAVGDEAKVNQGRYIIHESKNKFYLVEKGLNVIVSDLIDSYFVVDTSCGKRLKVSPSDIRLVKQLGENRRLEEAIRKEVEVLQLLRNK